MNSAVNKIASMTKFVKRAVGFDSDVAEVSSGVAEISSDVAPRVDRRVRYAVPEIPAFRNRIRLVRFNLDNTTTKEFTPEPRINFQKVLLNSMGSVLVDEINRVTLVTRTVRRSARIAQKAARMA